MLFVMLCWLPLMVLGSERFCLGAIAGLLMLAWMPWTVIQAPGRAMGMQDLLTGMPCVAVQAVGHSLRAASSVSHMTSSHLPARPMAF